MPSRLNRVDVELVRRKLARSREHAGQLIADGLVRVDGRPVHKPASQIARDASVQVLGSEAETYVSRGGFKLAGALAAFGERSLTVAGRQCLDAGASTGGFTEVLLRNGAAGVVAVDVGYGQLAWSLQTDPRVTVIDRTNVRTLTPEQLPFRPEVVVADLSFISLTLVLPALVACAKPGGDFVLMVKPQFEVGKERLGAGGVVREPELRAAAVIAVATAATAQGLGVSGVVASPLPGPSGNVEYFLWLRAGAPPVEESEVLAAVVTGPA